MASRPGRVAPKSDTGNTKKESPFEDSGRLIIFVLPMYKQLTSEQRSQIFALLQRKCPRKEIAHIVGTHRVNLVYFVLQRGIVVQAVVLKGLFIPCCTGTLQKLSATIIFFLLLQCFCLFFRALVFLKRVKLFVPDFRALLISLSMC